MPTISDLSSDNDNLDLSILDLPNFNIDAINQDQSKAPTKKSETEESLDLSSLDKLFPKEIQPISSPPAKITSKFGKRQDPFGLGVKFHNGVDIPIALNTPINSLGKGTVIETGDSGAKDYGKFVKVDYGGGLVLTYGHLNKVAVEQGDRVSAEAIVGLSGSTGRSKGPHLHIKAELNGKSVNPENYFGSIHNIAIGALTTDDVVDETKLDLSILDNLDESAISAEANKEELDLSAVDQIGDFAVKPIEEVSPIDKGNTFEEKVAKGGAAFSQQKHSVRSPDEYVGEPVRTSITLIGLGKRPNENQIVDAWLGALDPSYTKLNIEYRAKTGRNLVLLDTNRASTFKGHDKWEIAGRLTYGAKELINTYIEGRKESVDAGVEAVYLKNQQLDRQAKIVADEIVAAKKENVNRLVEKHPYIATAFNVLVPATLPLNDLKTTAQSSLGNTAESDAQLIHNLRMLPQAIYALYRYGGDSPEYQKLIERDREVQERLYGYAGEVKQPESFRGKVATGVATGVLSYPKYALAGSIGLPALPTLVYIENLYRGNIEATKAALPMALMVGATHGLDSFFGKGTDLYVTKLDKSGNPFIERVEIGKGLGNAAPFAKVKSELNNLKLNQDVTDAFVASEPVSIRSISPLTRQLIMRGTNAFTDAGTLALEGGSAQDVASNFVVGLTFPVSKSRTGSFEEGRFGLIPYIPSKEVPTAPLQLEQKKVLIPVTRGGDVVESDRRTLSTDSLASKLETGFQARNEGQTLYLNVDSAALNLLDLRRAIKDKTLGGSSTKDAINRQLSAYAAISILEKQIPKEIIDYFEKNEGLIRAGLKTNWEAVRAKEEYLGKKELTNEPKNPDEIKDNPSIDVKENAVDRLKRSINTIRDPKLQDNIQARNEAAKDALGDIGSQNNTWNTPDRFLFAADRFFNIKVKDGRTLRSAGPQDLATIGKDLVEGTKAIWDLTQMSAFFLEDFYHRRIEPSVAELENRFRLVLGDVVKEFKDEDFQILFQKGKEFYDSNVADPFFSRMKQDAVEKLPNRMNVEQARNVLVQHKDEFEWTAGLNEFLESNKDKKISKQELVDIIQKGQVRVEESVAQEIDANKIKAISKQIKELQAEIDKRDTTAGASDDYIHETTLLEEKVESLYEERDRIKFSQNDLKYSLNAYSSEKLELPGAKNSKEVKLISNIEIPVGAHDELRMVEYKSPHWNEPNVVAHYRANNRVSTDNKRIYFGEEFQSDWNHDIRELGPKRTAKEAYEYAENNVEETISEHGIVRYRIKPFGNEIITGNISRTKQGAIDNFVIVKTSSGIEPNPFMQHNWKELVLKRFLRDAAIAKDENGNYKYDAIGWTTARQQLERYGGILEGKEFQWFKNADGTYTFNLKTGENYWQGVHELNNISLERFAELTTKEAADFVREQEKVINENRNRSNIPTTDLTKFPTSTEKFNYEGQFSLSETVELRSREGTYADYDIAYKNILSKIGKRFGAKYSEREIEATERPNYSTREYFSEKFEKIHSLEITPSMRESLSKKGMPLYGTGGSEPLKYPEIGVRNKIVTADAFNTAREDLVQKLTQTNKESKGTTFNSGLNPDAFIDQIKLLYSGIKDLTEFTNKLVSRYGEPIHQFAEDFYYAIKQQAADFKEKLSIDINNWSDNLSKNKDSAAWKIREFAESEEGALKLPKFLRKDMLPEVENYLKDPESHQKPIGADIRAWMRGVALSQVSGKFAKVYDTMRTLQRVVANYETTTLNQLLLAKKLIKAKLDTNVAEAIYAGNEWIDPATGDHKGKVWSNTELISNFSLDPQQIDAYRNVRSAIDNVLNLRLEGKLYAVREKANKLNAKLQMAAPGSAEELSLKTQLLDLGDAETKMISYYNDLKSSGYITLQRKGNIAVYLEDPSFPVGDPNRKIYNQFRSRNQAVKWIEGQKRALGIPRNTVAGRMYDIKNIKEIALKEQLTPSQFEDLVDRSGAHTNDAEVEKIRSEVYSKFPSFTYQLKREFVRGYDRDLQTAINSTVDQLELYASSFYSKVGREEGLKALEATGIEKTDPNLYRLSSSYINDETQAAKINWFGKAAITARRGTYLFQLGFDVNQWWMNTIAQPITNNYQYFYRVKDPSGSGRELTGLEPEHFFKEGVKLAAEVYLNKVPTKYAEFNDIVKRLKAERVLSPEFTRAFIEAEAGGRRTSKVENWASIFMQMGEHNTRLHAASEGYLVGKEKFGLSGEDLVNFIVRGVDATQSNPTRGENPFVIRQLGEGGKLFYQFAAFNQMWLENLALGVKDSKGIKRKSLFLSREFAPLAIIGGISGLPLANAAGMAYTLITGRDPKKDWDKFLGDDTLIEQLARYGVTTSATISRKVTPSVPIVDTALQLATSPTAHTVGDYLEEATPAFATAEQIRKGTMQVVGGDYFKGIINLSPRALRGPLKVVQTSREGYKAGEDTVLSRRKISILQKVGQAANIMPTPVVEHYDKERTKRLKKIKVFKKLRRAI